MQARPVKWVASGLPPNEFQRHRGPDGDGHDDQRVVLNLRRLAETGRLGNQPKTVSRRRRRVINL
jgi:hypothetical protein